LNDGRTLAYEDVGGASGSPVFFFHGTPGSRLARHPDAELTVAAGARLITVDRPGYGDSSRRPGRRLTDWASDVSELADALGLGRFSVVGWSGGGPHALAVAHQLPERVAAVALASPLGAVDAPGALSTVKPEFRLLWWLRLVPPAIKFAAWVETEKARKNASRYVKGSWLKGAPPVDRRTIRLTRIREMAESDVAEAAKQGWVGYFDDLVALTEPWGFSAQEVRQSVALWHGLADSWLYPEMARSLAAALPECDLRLLPNEGHFLVLTNWSDILTDIVRRS
jgi:pimeloyl-ACP methyl ester carboxylesterase